jgi:hypothetical protein
MTAVIIAAVMVTACSGSVPRVSPEMALYAGSTWPDRDMAELEDGRRLFIVKCASCHNLPSPRDCTAEKWPEEMRIMGKKSKLSEDETERILHFLLAARETNAR